jgi:hypothetical protein
MRDAAGWIARRWDGFWFAEETARNLAAARVVVAAQALWLVLSRDHAAISGLPPEFWSQVPTSARLRFLLFAGHSDLERGLHWIAVLALAAALLGVWARTACFVAGILLYHLAPLESIIWTPAPYVRGLTLAVLALLVLSFAPCGDALGVWRRGRGDRPPLRGWTYGWPLRLIQLFVCEVYLFSGYAKLHASGWRWASADNIRNWLLYASQDESMAVFRSLGPWIAERPLLCQLVGAAALALELGFVTALFWKRSRRWLVPLALLFHVGILFSMNLTFPSLPLLLVFVDWDALRARCARWAVAWRPGRRAAVG